MSRRFLVACGLAIVIVVMSWSAISLAAQATASQVRQAKAAWTPPRTPWGDPDLQGNYTNKYEHGTPFERPQEFEGRR